MFGHFHVSLFATRVKFKLPLCVSPISDPMTWKHDAFQHLWGNLSVRFSTVPSSRAGSSTLVLEEWFTNFLALLVEKPFEVPMLYNLLVRLQKLSRVCKCFHFMHGSCPVTSKRQGFQESLWRSLQTNSGNPLHVSNMESGQDSSTSVMEGISFHASPLFRR